MADNSYSETVVARLELNLSDFRAKMKIADAALDGIASDKDIKRTGSNKGFSQTGDELIGNALAGLEVVAEDVMNQSLYEVPRDTETLANSAEIQPPVQKVDGRISIELGYGYGTDQNPKTGRFADQYALPVHEIWDAEHDPPTKSHYLIDPLLENSFSFGTTLKRFMQGRAVAEDINIDRRVFLFRKGGGPGIAALRGARGFIKRPNVK